MRKLEVSEMRYDNLRILILPDVYRPAEDTFLILENLDLDSCRSFLEIGCGCGIISLIAARTCEKVVSVDINPIAVENTILNAFLNNLNVDARLGDVFSPIKPGEIFDIIVFNPPYLPPEPAGDVSWSCKVESLRRFLIEYERYLTEMGRAYVVLSSLTPREVWLAIRESRRWRVKKIRRLFFEKLYLLEARMRT